MPISRSGTKYAAGSHMVRGDYPKNCAECGEFVPLNDCWQEEIKDVKKTYHHECRRRKNESA